MEPLTKTQRSRFTNLVERIAKKVEGTFGNTKESADLFDAISGATFEGDVQQTLEVVSRGMCFRVTFHAFRLGDDD